MSLISRTFKLLLEVDLSRVLSLFQTHPQSTLKPQPSRSVLSWKIRRRQGFLQMMSHDTTSTGKEGKGVKGGVTRSARSPCPLPALYLLTPHHHLLVNVLPPPKLVWNISKSKSCHPHSSDVPFDSETSSVAENITRVNIWGNNLGMNKY